MSLLPKPVVGATLHAVAIAAMRRNASALVV
jgi:hypothetical protein